MALRAPARRRPVASGMFVAEVFLPVEGVQLQEPEGPSIQSIQHELGLSANLAAVLAAVRHALVFGDALHEVRHELPESA